MSNATNNHYSVLMSIYHREKPEYFIESIESMLKQTIIPSEIVIVKDGPLTADLDRLIASYKKSYPRTIKIVELPMNMGLGLALNEGLVNCNHELIARMDTDDISKENRCEKQLRAFTENPELCIVGTNIDEFYENPNNVVASRVVPEKHNDILRYSRRRSPFNHPAVMYKKSAVKRVGGYRDIHRKEDLDLFIRMLHSGCTAMNIQESLLLFRANVDNYRRRKDWVNCINYIKVIFGFWKLGYSSFWDLIVVTMGQVLLIISPLWLVRLLSDSLLRVKVKHDE